MMMRIHPIRFSAITLNPGDEGAIPDLTALRKELQRHGGGKFTVMVQGDDYLTLAANPNQRYSVDGRWTKDPEQVIPRVEAGIAAAGEALGYEAVRMQKSTDPARQ